MATKVLLEVEDRELVILLEREELAKRRIRVDRLLVHELVLLAVGRDGLGDVGAADLRVLGLAKEGEELIGDRNGRREDAGLGHRTLDRRLLVLALTIRFLGEAGRELLERLRVGRRLGVERLDLDADLVLACERLGDERREILIRSSRRSIGRRGRCRSRCSGDNRGRNRRSGYDRGGSSGRLLGLRGRNRRGSNGSGSRNSRGRNNGLSDLRNRLLGRLGGGGSSSAHFDSVRGSI